MKVCNNASHGQKQSALASIVVCGRFHFHNYIERLAELGGVSQFIYSHRRATRYRLKGAESVNLFLKEYLYQGHSRILGPASAARWGELYHQVWRWQLSGALRPASVVHFLANGTSGQVIRRRRGDFDAVIAEAVNSHPRHYHSVIGEEERYFGLPSSLQGEIPPARVDEIDLSDCLLVPSRAVADSFVACGYAREKMKVLPFGGHFQESSARRARQTGETFRAVCIAQVTVRKGHRFLLEAWRRLALPNAELHLYGIIDERIRPKLEALGGPGVIFHGPVDRATIARALAAASVFVLPTLEEGFAVSVLEAMAAGCPVITTTASGAEGVMEPGVHGWLVPPKSIEALEMALSESHANPEGAEQQGIAAARLVRDRYNWDVYASELASLYADMLAAR